ncbi:NrfD/PsrC family molybdoenzyme membrane anchor subunit [Streptosporangium sp. NPDC050855]|uniref:NrfD/PsrC family molybdoenzyme membrane anchor subunit n=1 Tax=Streptosporangium sp. NPDC050855 TaxID=3366194 RepID=UPI00379D8809
MTAAHEAHVLTPQPPWGPLLAAYIVLVGLPGGLTLVTWPLARRHSHLSAGIDRYGAWAALTTLLLVSVLLVVDLGRPERFHLMITRFDNPASPIAVGAKLIAIKTFLLSVLVYGLERRRRSADTAVVTSGRITSLLSGALLLTSFALAVYPAALLSRSWASPLAGTSGSALIFVITALLMGAAAVLLVTSLLDVREGEGGHTPTLHLCRRAVLALLGALGVTLSFEMLSLAGRPPDRLLLAALLTGNLATVFWGLVVVVGIAVPATALLLFPGRRMIVVTGAAAALTGAAATRYLLFAVGQ